jgi:hypothetical protein
LLIGSPSKSQEATPSWPYSIMRWAVESAQQLKQKSKS